MTPVIASHIVPILVVSGIATAGAIAMTVAPRASYRFAFGADPADDLAVFLAGYVGLLVALFGCLIVYGAVNSAVRTAILAAASVEKLAFVTPIAFGWIKRTPVTIVAAAADGCFIVLYLAYLAGL